MNRARRCSYSDVAISKGVQQVANVLKSRLTTGHKLNAAHLYSRIAFPVLESTRVVLPPAFVISFSPFGENSAMAFRFVPNSSRRTSRPFVTSQSETNQRNSSRGESVGGSLRHFVIIRVLSRATFISLTGPGCSNSFTSRPVETSHKRAVASSAAVMMFFPPKQNVAARIPLLWPSNACTSQPFFTSHVRALISLHAART